VRMTADRPADTLREPVPGRTEQAERGLPDRTILSMCDDLLGEVGRRDHIFAWLRAPGADLDEWLPVDAYYPRARLVVLCRSGSGPHDTLYRELIPAHGLGLMTLDPAALGPDSDVVRQTLAARIFDLERVPRERARPEPRPRKRFGNRPEDRPENRSETRPENRSEKRLEGRPEKRPPAPATSDSRGSPAPEWTPVKVEHTSVPRGYVHGAGVLAGLVLASVLIAELYLGVIVVGVHDGRLLLGLAIALEACSRILGTVAAERAGQRGWAFACAIAGAPAVAWFALLRPSGRVEVEPAPLGGLLAVLAGVVAVVGILI
jgi:hypothetical protein